MKSILQNGVIRNSKAPAMNPSSDPVIGTVGASDNSPAVTSNDSVTPFLESLQANHVSENTIRSYAADISRFIAFMQQRGRITLNDMHTADINLFLQQLTIDDASVSTIRRRRSALRKFFRFAFENGTVATDPFEGTLLEEIFSDHLTLSTILNIAVYCQRRYEAESSGEVFRYRRDELVLLFIILYGLRQYQIPTLKLSSMKRDGNAVVIAVSEQFTRKLDGIVLRKLYRYLKLRDSKADIMFVEPKTGKPVAARSLHSLMIELSYAVRVQVNPRTLHHTFLHLQHHHEDASQLLRELSKLEEEVSP
jgi:site-specific recombinase XerD